MYPAAFIDAVLERLHEAPEREAFRDGRSAVTRGELFAATGRFAFGLLQQGVRSGDRLLLGLPPDRRHVVALIGALRLGVVVVPIHPKAKPREIQHVLWDAGPRVVCADAPLADLVRTCSAAVRPLDVKALSAPAPAPAAGDDEEIELAREHAGAAAKPDDRALILYTSGTTGKPKGALHTQGSLAANTAALRAAWRLGPDDRLLHCLPLHHLHGLVVGVMSCLAAGTPIVLEPGFDAERIVARLAETGATLFFGVPAMYAQLVQAAPLAPPSMRLFVSGSAPLAPALKREFEKRFGHVILERYGTTETGIALSQSPDEARPAGAVGRPLEGVETKVVPVEGAPMDENGAKGADGADEGELLVSGPSLFRGYFDDEEATAQALHDGWYRTGDLVRRAADGSFRILGRITTDLIKVKGHRVGALEVEAALADHPRVAEAAVVGAPDAECGEVPVAFVRARDAALTADELLAHARAVLAPHQVPRRIELVDELPRTGPGKVDKKLLQARARGA
jgi:acyl-CoA synthetase (AMP-forming)/AMP-acid ligase II